MINKWLIDTFVQIVKAIKINTCRYLRILSDEGSPNRHVDRESKMLWLRNLDNFLMTFYQQCISEVQSLNDTLGNI